MSGSLEERYRRMLAWYPQRHRDLYEEEMLDVLLTGAGPDQTHPSPGESANLLRSALRARLGAAVTSLSDTRWREAAATVGLLVPMLMVLKQARLPIVSEILAARTDGPAAISMTSWLLLAGWAATSAFAARGRRTAAAVAAWASLLGQTSVLAGLYPGEPVTVLHAAWTVVLGMTAAVALTATRRPTPDATILGRRSAAFFGAAALLMLAWPAADPLLGQTSDVGHGRWVILPPPAEILRPDLGRGLGAQGLVAQLLLVAAMVAVAVGVWQIAPLVRRRVLAFLAPVAAVIVLVSTTFQGFIDSSPRFNPPVLLVTGQWLMLTLTPLLTFALAAALVHRRESRLELLELGRMARRLRTE